MAILSKKFRGRLLESWQHSVLLSGVLCIKILDIEADKKNPSVTLEVVVLDPNTNELLVEQEAVVAFSGDTVKFENLKKTFKIKIR